MGRLAAACLPRGTLPVRVDGRLQALNAVSTAWCKNMSVISSLLTASGIGDLQAAMLAVFLLFLIPFFYCIYRVRRGVNISLRAIPAYASLKHLMARAAEAGQPVHVSVGTAGVGSSNTAETLAGLTTLEFLADRAAVSDIPPVMTVTDPTTLPAVQDRLKFAYARQGYPEEYNPLQARFIAPPLQGSAVAYAAGVMNLLAHEPAMANVMVGTFGDEYVLMAEPAAQRGMLQVGGTSNPNVLPVAQLTMTQPLLGEEIFAAGAYLYERVGHLGSLLAQDVFRVALVVFILLAVLARTLGLF